MKIKVSNVCQLVDKSKIPTTRTISGVTFTNNGDGSVTVDGTSTRQYYSEIVIPIDDSLFIPGHVYLNGTIKGDFAGFVALYGPVAKDYLMAPQYIYTLPSGKDFNKFRYIIRVDKGRTANNYKCTPQLFDLTKMYGAGNEPKTVAQFRQDFPNEMYEYSPVCWKRCKELKYVTETKNLFDISKVITSNAVKRNSNSLICSVYGTSIGTLGSICPTLKPSDLITISFKCASEGVPSKYMAFDGRTFYSGATFLVSEIGLSASLYLYKTDYEHMNIPNKTTYSDIQVELGSTATPYQPYGYLPLRTGRYRTETRNLFDINAEMHDANKPAYYIEVMGNIVKTNYDISHVGHPYIEVPVEIGETYTFSCNAYRSSDIINVYSRVRYPDNTIVTYIGNGPVNKTFTATQSSVQVCFGIDTYGTWDTSQFALIYNIQLEKGTTATHYQPYKHIYFH